MSETRKDERCEECGEAWGHKYECVRRASPPIGGAGCEFCAGTIDHHATGCDAAHPPEAAPRGEGKAVAIIASEISDAIDAHDSGENVNATQRAAHVLNALLPEMNDYWHNGYTEGKKDAALLAALLAAPSAPSPEVTESESGRLRVAIGEVLDILRDPKLRPTDRDASDQVREGLVRVLKDSRYALSFAAVTQALGLNINSVTIEEVADALIAAVRAECGENCEHAWRGLVGGAMCLKCGTQVALHEDICKAIGTRYATIHPATARGVTEAMVDALGRIADVNQSRPAMVVANECIALARSALAARDAQ